MRYVANAFSLNMLASLSATINSVAIGAREAAAWAEGAQSIVGHPDTAAVMSATLGTPVQFNRESVQLRPGDELLVGQYRGPRLPEGAKVLPEGARFEWAHVKIIA